MDGRLRAISVFIVSMGFKHHIRLFFLPRIINFSSKCFMQITELQDGTHSERLTNLFHCCNKYGFSKGNKNVVIPFSLLCCISTVTSKHNAFIRHIELVVVIYVAIKAGKCKQQANQNVQPKCSSKCTTKI